MIHLKVKQIRYKYRYGCNMKKPPKKPKPTKTQPGDVGYHACEQCQQNYFGGRYFSERCSHFQISSLAKSWWGSTKFLFALLYCVILCLINKGQRGKKKIEETNQVQLHCLHDWEASGAMAGACGYSAPGRREPPPGHSARGSRSQALAQRWCRRASRGPRWSGERGKQTEFWVLCSLCSAVSSRQEACREAAARQGSCSCRLEGVAPWGCGCMRVSSQEAQRPGGGSSLWVGRPRLGKWHSRRALCERQEDTWSCSRPFRPPGQGATATGVSTSWRGKAFLHRKKDSFCPRRVIRHLDLFVRGKKETLKATYEKRVFINESKAWSCYVLSQESTMFDHLKHTREVLATAAAGHLLHVQDTPCTHPHTPAHTHTRTHPHPPTPTPPHTHTHARARSEGTPASLLLDLHFQCLFPSKVSKINSEWKQVTFCYSVFHDQHQG